VSKTETISFLNQLLPVQAANAHPEEDDGDECDDQNHEEANAGADEGRRVDAHGVLTARGVLRVEDHVRIRRLIDVRLGSKLELNVVGSQNLTQKTISRPIG